MGTCRSYVLFLLRGKATFHLLKNHSDKNVFSPRPADKSLRILGRQGNVALARIEPPQEFSKFRQLSNIIKLSQSPYFLNRTPVTPLS